MVQIEVLHEKTQAHNVVWVSTEWKLKPGKMVKFVDDKKYWRVSKVYETKAEFVDLEKKWGLALPKSQRTER